MGGKSGIEKKEIKTGPTCILISLSNMKRTIYVERTWRELKIIFLLYPVLKLVRLKIRFQFNEANHSILQVNNLLTSY